MGLMILCASLPAAGQNQSAQNQTAADNPQIIAAGEILKKTAGDFFLGRRSVSDVISFTCTNGKIQAVSKLSAPSGVECAVLIKGMPGLATFLDGVPHKQAADPTHYIRFHYLDPSNPGVTLIRTDVDYMPDHLNISQFRELADDAIWSVQIAQSSADGPQVLNIYIQDQRADPAAQSRRLTGATLTDLAQDNPADIDAYVRPIFRTLNQEPAVFVAPPQAAYQALADLWQPDAKLAADTEAAVAGMAADAFADREVALARLHELGEPAALYLMRAGSKSWNTEQRMRVDLFLGSYRPLTDEDAQRLGRQPDFLLDALYNSDALLRKLAIRRLNEINGGPVDFDESLAGDALQKAVLKLRMKLAPGVATKELPTPHSP